MSNGVNGITDAEVKDRIRIATALVKKAKQARLDAIALAREAAKDEQEVWDIVDKIFKKAMEGGGVDVTPDQIQSVLEAAVNGALETRRAADRVNQAVLHPSPGALNIQMMLAAADGALRDGDLVGAYSRAGVAIRGCEDAIAALDAVKQAEDTVDKAIADAKAWGN